MSLKQIADIVGVSVSTVSRVLNNKSYKCASPELKDKIWSVAKELHYTPNLQARSLKSGTSCANPSYHLTVILARFDSFSSDPFFSELLRSIEQEAFRQNCTIDAVLTRDLPGTFFSENAGDMDGIVILGRCSEQLFSRLRKFTSNLIYITRNSSSYTVDEIICDGAKAASVAMEYLLSLGHKKIAYIGDCSYESRYIGYTQTLLKYCLPLDFSLIRQTNQTQKGGFGAMKEFMEDALPQAILCANDATAIGALCAYQEGGDLEECPAIIGIDNLLCIGDYSPLLTSVNIPKFEMGQMAVKLLIDRIQKGHYEYIKVEFPCKLMIRESC